MSEETKDEVLKLPLPEGMTRMECGPVQFGDDWPGYFLRGDRAFHLLQGRETVLSLIKTGDTRPSVQLWAAVSLSGIPDMKRCIVGGVLTPVKPAKLDTAEELLLRYHQITNIEVSAHTRPGPSIGGIAEMRYNTGWCTVTISVAGEEHSFDTTNVVGALLMGLAQAQKEARAVVAPKPQPTEVPA